MFSTGATSLSPPSSLAHSLKLFFKFFFHVRRRMEAISQAKCETIHQWVWKFNWISSNHAQIYICAATHPLHSQKDGKNPAKKNGSHRYGKHEKNANNWRRKRERRFQRKKNRMHTIGFGCSKWKRKETNRLNQHQAHSTISTRE